MRGTTLRGALGRRTPVVRLPRLASSLDPELFPQNAYVKSFVTNAVN